MMNDLARRAVACKHWRWMPGMAIDGLRVTHVNENKNASACGDYTGAATWEVSERSVPDLTDPATLGCLLALVREAWDDPTICCRITDGRIGGPDGPFAWEFNGRIKHGWGLRTEAETLVAALEAAP